MRRVCIIGLDGVNLKVIRKLISTGYVSNLGKILDKGYTYCPLSIPPYTPIAWTSIFTGVNAGKHGIFGFLSIKKQNKKLIVRLNSARDVSYPRLFEILSLNRLKSVIGNIPFTYPTSDIVRLENITVISDWASPKQFIFPSNIEDRYKDFLVDPPHKWHRFINVNEYINVVHDFLNSRLQIYYDMSDREDISLFVVIFSELDWLMHRIPDIVLGRNISRISKILQAIDKFIGTALNKFDLVVIASDHGFRIIDKIININSLLARLGLYRYKIVLDLGKLINKYGGSLTPASDHTHINPTLSRIFHIFLLLGQRLFTLTRVLTSEKLFRQLVLLTPISVIPDLLSSKIAMLESGSWSIYFLQDSGFNLQESVFRSIKRSGLIKGILTKHELFWGSHINEAPDIFLIPDENVSFGTNPFADIIVNRVQSDHHPEAFLAMYGDYILRGSSQKMCSLFDITPTILAYLGLPIPTDTDGKVLSEAFDMDLTFERKNYTTLFKKLKKLRKKARKLLT